MRVQGLGQMPSEAKGRKASPQIQKGVLAWLEEAEGGAWRLLARLREQPEKRGHVSDRGSQCSCRRPPSLRGEAQLEHLWPQTIYLF